jgi:hypothetical protein
MMKPFIAAISIAYILSIPSISDAKNVKNIRKIDRAQPCQDPVNLSSEYNQLAKYHPTLNKDLQSICQLINQHYLRKHQSIPTYPPEHLPANKLSVLGITEVESIKLIEYSKGKAIGQDANATVKIKSAVREYTRENSSWKLVKTESVTYHFIFVKKNDEWVFQGNLQVARSDRP